MRLGGQAIGLGCPGEGFEVLALAKCREKVVEECSAVLVN